MLAWTKKEASKKTFFVAITLLLICLSCCYLGNLIAAVVCVTGLWLLAVIDFQLATIEVHTKVSHAYQRFLTVRYAEIVLLKQELKLASDQRTSFIQTMTMITEQLKLFSLMDSYRGGPDDSEDAMMEEYERPIKQKMH